MWVGVHGKLIVFGVFTHLCVLHTYLNFNPRLTIARAKLPYISGTSQ